LVFDERSAVFCWEAGCCAVLVDPLLAGDCAWFVPEAGGLPLCVFVFGFEDGFVCAWLEGVVVWLGWLVCAWLVELFDAGACAVLVPLPDPDGWLVALCPVEGGDCVWEELLSGLA